MHPLALYTQHKTSFTCTCFQIKYENEDLMCSFLLDLSFRQVGGKLEVLRLSIQLLVDWLLIQNGVSTGMAYTGTPSPSILHIYSAHMHVCHLVHAGLPWLAVGVIRLVCVFSLVLWIAIAAKESMKDRKVKVQ